LDLKATALDDLNLPVKVLSGHLGDSTFSVVLSCDVYTMTAWFLSAPQTNFTIHGGGGPTPTCLRL